MSTAPRSRRVLLGGGLAAMATGATLVPGRAEAAPGTDPWRLGGNAGVTDTGTNFLGTRNVAPLIIKTAAVANTPVERMRITPAGRVGVGTDAPNALLHARAANGAAVRGQTTGPSIAGIGVDGVSGAGTGVTGRHVATSGTNPGVLGETESTSSSAIGVLGQVNPASPGGFSAGVRGISNGTGGSGIGVWGSHAGAGWGVYGNAAGANGIGVYGYAGSTSTAYGVYGGTGASDNNWAGYFSGNVNVTGTVNAPLPLTRIDHPLAPADKYLQHATVQSPEMLTVHNGTVVTDADGRATVPMPAWFTALNRDFRYQLTAIGRAEVWIERELEDGAFVIGSGTPRAKVSWQVTGVRTDPWAEQHPVVVEPAKPKDQRGRYLHPELYGAPSARREGPAAGGAPLDSGGTS